MIHRNSLNAYRAEGRRLHSREIEILIWSNIHTGSYTDRKVAELMGFAHRSEVQPRISDLIADGLMCENGKTPCDVTGRPVRTVRITEKGKRWLAGERQTSTPTPPAPCSVPPAADYTPDRHIIPEHGQCALFK